MEKLLRDKSVYDFLRLEADEGYHDCEAFIEAVRFEYFRWVSSEVYDSMGLVATTEYDRQLGLTLEKFNVKLDPPKK